MKRHRELVALVCICCCLPSRASFSQWEQTNGPWGGDIFCFAVKGTTLFAGTSTGVFSSTNNGTSWTNIYPPKSDTLRFEAGIVRSLLVRGSTLYAGTWRGLYRSTDNGAAWSLVLPSVYPSDLPYSNYGNLTAMGDSLFAVIGGVLYRSNENFAGWTEVDSGFRYATGCIAACGGALFTGVRWQGIFRSTDYGDTWATVNSGLDTNLTCLAAKGNILFAGTAQTGIYRSTNSGDSWMTVNTGLGRDSVSCLYASDGILFAVLNHNRVYRSADNGDSWTGGSIGLPAGVQCLVMNGGALFAGASTSGVFRSDDSGSHWSPDGSGIQRRSIRSIAVSGKNLFADATAGRDIFLSTDNGDTWEAVCLGINNTDYRSLTANGNRAFLSTRGGGVFTFSYNGSAWTTVHTSPESNYVNALVVSGDNAVAGTDSGIYLSADNGLNWKTTGTGNAVFSLAASGNNVFAGAIGQIMVSTDNGASWGSPCDSFSNNPVKSIAVHGNFIFASGYKDNPWGGFRNSSDSGVFRSSDIGSTWNNCGPKGIPVISLAVGAGTVFAAAGNGTGVFRSTDDGSTWNQYNEGLGNLEVSTIRASDDFVFACAFGGLWRRQLRAKVETRPGTIAPAKDLHLSALGSARGTMKIEFSLLHPAKVAFALFDPSGRRKDLIKPENLNAGFYSFVWDARTIPQGCYAARFAAGTQTSVRFITIVR